MQEITLPWMDRIRERLEYMKDYLTPEELGVINLFLNPILNYGIQEEVRIAKKFEVDNDVAD